VISTFLIFTDIAVPEVRLGQYKHAAAQRPQVATPTRRCRDGQQSRPRLLFKEGMLNSFRRKESGWNSPCCNFFII
jgi:hypothetical protein